MAVSPSVKARILEPSAENIALAAEQIRRSQVVAMPTETVYGLAGSLWDEAALARIFETKERPRFDPLIAHVSPALLRSYAADPLEALEKLGVIDRSRLSHGAIDRARALVHAFWPGPLTLVFPKQMRVPDLATSGLDSVAVRMPQHAVAQALIDHAGVPLAAPSANRFGRISPTSAEAVLSELGDRIDIILNGGSCDVGLESTIVRVADPFELLRQGGVSVEKIESIAPFRLRIHSKHAPSGPQPAAIAPGMLESHYAPEKRLILLPHHKTPEAEKAWKKELMRFASIYPHGALITQSAHTLEWLRTHCPECLTFLVYYSTLSTTENAIESARNLFRYLRQMDESKAEFIAAESCQTEEGLFAAIQDRLKRASFSR